MPKVRKKPARLFMRVKETWEKKVEIAAEVLGESKTDIVEKGTEDFIDRLAQKNKKLKRALVRAA